MASSPAMKFFLLLLFTLLSYPQTQARDSQLFNKVSSSSAAATTAVPNQDPPLINNNQQEQEPSFFPQEKENGYGLYGHESGQLPHSATGAAAEYEDHPNRHLPRNYNHVAYLTESEEDTDDNENDNEDEDSYTTTLQNYYNDARKSKQKQKEDEETREPEQYRSYDNNNNQYSGGSSFNSDAARNSRENYLYNGGEGSGFRPQGMSDTRSLENGKYFYDIKTEKYRRNHPYAVLNRAGANNNYNGQRNYYGANENSMSESYQNQYEFQNEGNMT